MVTVPLTVVTPSPQELARLPSQPYSTFPSGAHGTSQTQHAPHEPWEAGVFSQAPQSAVSVLPFGAVMLGCEVLGLFAFRSPPGPSLSLPHSIPKSCISQGIGSAEWSQRKAVEKWGAPSSPHNDTPDLLLNSYTSSSSCVFSPRTKVASCGY